MPRNQHTRVDVVRLTQLREDSAAVVRQAAPAGQKIPCGIVPGLHRTGISRARQGCTSNPLYRLVLWFFVLPPCASQLLINWLQDQLNMLRAAAPGSVRELSLVEQSIEGRESALQLRVAQGDLAAMREWKQELLAERAVIDQLVVAIDQELAAAPAQQMRPAA